MSTLSQYLESHNLQFTPIIQTISSLIIGVAFLISSAYIPLLCAGDNYIPTPLDYVRVLLISLMSSISLNFSFTLISKLSLVLKVIVEFLAILLLALPQKSEVERGHKGWNLTRREVYLFGIGMQVGNLIFYVWDLWNFDDLNQTETSRYEKVVLSPDQQASDHLNYEQFHQYVSKKSTLANCIEVRKKTKSLKKNVYSNAVYPTSSNNSLSDPESQLETDGLLLSITPSSNQMYGLSMDPSAPPPPILRLRDPNSTESNYANCTTAADKSMLYALNITLFGAVFNNDSHLWFYPILTVLLTSMMECGLSLMLSICFIYVPGFDDSLFTKWEILFYDRLWLFSGMVVIPCWMVSLLMIWYLLSLSNWCRGANKAINVSDEDDITLNEIELAIRAIGFTIVSVALFVVGLKYA
ncbi:hypothetical protein WICPIJ_000325 [Wickerhamomyces pijperi]|uniref:Uncharacterized protein n=1 Tax=Wickerhamomyces pijperi TaxID=599730 RepID=A0A9P8QGT8_WICPI|nr:hypothetical protein WICPIJ_000325 [Wickerhamomyces pijperi]